MAPFSLLLSTLLLSVITLVSSAPTTGSENATIVELDPRAPAQVITKCTVPNTVALTFDDGPYWFMREVIRQVEAAGGNTTFFVSAYHPVLSASPDAASLTLVSPFILSDGNNWACIYNTELSGNIRYAFERGHQIASHTWQHKDLTTLTWDQIHHQMWLTEQAITRITGAVPAYMRPPYGNHNALVREAAGVRGQNIVLWDFDSGDSTGSTVAQQKANFDQLAARHPSNILSLQHDVHWSTVYETLPHAISVLKAKGYRFVTVADCLGTRKYQRVGPAEPRNANWVC
ncbi:hypothetical protein H1R20_g8370, partial [Candolleomyces eurysporus]